MCASCITPPLIFSVTFAVTEPRLFKHKIRQHNTSEWHSPLFPQFETRTARMQSFNTWPQPAKSLIDPVFFRAGTHFQHKNAFITGNNNSSKNQLKLFSLTGPRNLVSCYYCGLTLEDLQETDSTWEKHTQYNPYCIYLLERKQAKYVLDNDRKSK